MSKSNFTEVETLKYFLTNGVMAARPTAWFASLHTADPGDTGAAEVAGAGYSNYARVAVTFAAPTSVDAGPSTTSNTAALSYPALSGTGVTVTHCAVYDALTAGNMLYAGPLDVAKALVAGEVLSFAAGELKPTEA